MVASGSNFFKRGINVFKLTAWQSSQTRNSFAILNTSFLAIEVQKLLTIGKYFFFPFFKSASCLTVIVLLFAFYCKCGKTPQTPPKTLKTDSRRPIPHHPATKTDRGSLVPYFQK